MKATGIVRRIDDLGRVVIPKEIRRTLRIREGDPLEIFTDREGEIILKKYSPIGELAAFAGMYADSLAKEAGCLVCICDMDQVVAASGNGRKEVQEKYISKVLQGELEERNSILAKVDEKKYIRVFREQEKDYVWESITPIICEGDVVGGVILLSSDEKEKFTKLDKSWGHVRQDFLESKWSDKICRSSHIRRIWLIPCGRQGGKRWRICKKI